MTDRPGFGDAVLWAVAVARPLALLVVSVLALRARRRRWHARRGVLLYAPSNVPTLHDGESGAEPA